MISASPLSGGSGFSAVPTLRERLEAAAGEEAARGAAAPAKPGEEPQKLKPVGEAKDAQAPSDATKKPSAEGELTEAEEAQVKELKARDREVRTHEQAHKTVGGQYAGAISYEYQTGPDGVRYAVGGSVPIDVSAEDTPEATIAKMQIVIRAALAPAEPSAADRAVANQARVQLAAAQAEAAATPPSGESEQEQEDAGAVTQTAAAAAENGYGVVKSVTGAAETPLFQLAA